VGTPLTDGLVMLHNALVGTGLRGRLRIGASGKVATGTDIVKRLMQGADYTNSARAMMMATGCIQAQKCHTNECPVGVATQDPRRARALVVADKAPRVARYQAATVAQAQQMIASLGLGDPAELQPAMLMRRIDHVHTASYLDLYDWLEPGELLAEPPADWAEDWAAASADSFIRQTKGRPE
jgi:glutamate synthase domain-containing protein 2